MTDATQLPGERLREERQRQGLTERDAADKLHLSVSYLQALEADDYEHLPEPTFIKGYLRNYARLLGLPADELAAAFDALQQPAPAPVTVPQAPAPVVTRQTLVLAAVALVLVAILLGWWLSADAGRELGAADAPAVTATDAAQPEVQAPPPQEQPQEPAPAGATNAEPVDIAAPAPVATPPAQSADLKMTFSADCWVEVADAAGKSLFKGVRRANTSLTLTGQTPFQVMLGNAAGVTGLSVDGKPVELPKAAAGEVINLRVP